MAINNCFYTLFQDAICNHTLFQDAIANCIAIFYTNFRFLYIAGIFINVVVGF